MNSVGMWKPTHIGLLHNGVATRIEKLGDLITKCVEGAAHGAVLAEEKARLTNLLLELAEFRKHEVDSAPKTRRSLPPFLAQQPEDINPDAPWNYKWPRASGPLNTLLAVGFQFGTPVPILRKWTQNSGAVSSAVKQMMPRNKLIEQLLHSTALGLKLSAQGIAEDVGRAGLRYHVRPSVYILVPRISEDRAKTQRLCRVARFPFVVEAKEYENNSAIYLTTADGDHLVATQALLANEFRCGLGRGKMKKRKKLNNRPQRPLRIVAQPFRMDSTARQDLPTGVVTMDLLANYPPGKKRNVELEAKLLQAMGWPGPGEDENRDLRSLMRSTANACGAILFNSDTQAIVSSLWDIK